MALFARSKLERGSDRYKRALEAALSVSEIASGAVAVPGAVDQVLATAMELFRADQGSVMLLDETRKNLILMASSGLPPEVKPGFCVPVGEGVAGRVLITGRSLLLEQVEQGDFINFIPKHRPIVSSVVAPLRAERRTIGVLSLSTTTDETAFTEEDRRLAQMFADQAANLIDRTRLHEQAELRSADLAALVESSEKLLGAIDVGELLQAILEGAVRCAGASGGIACILGQDVSTVRQGVFRGIDRGATREVLRHPDTVAAVENGDLRELHLESGPHVALGFGGAKGSRGLIVLPGGSALLKERGHLLRAFGQQCSSALGAADLYSVVEQKESQLASIIQSVPIPIVLADSEGCIVSLNPSAEQLFGISAAFCEGAPIENALSHPELESFLLKQGDLQGEVQLGVPPRSFKVRATDVRVPGVPSGRVLVMDDITREKEMAATQHDFVAMVGHELRTPLTIVKGFTRLLLGRGDSLSEEDKREALHTIDAKTAHLERIVEDLLYVSGIESREQTLRIDQVRVGRVIEEVVTDLLQSHRERTVRLDIPDDLVWGCDGTKLALVARHLIDNALKYSGRAEPVHVRAFVEGTDLRVDVVDRGPGLVSSDIPHVFERFRQLDGTATREHGGMGVGLYLCARLVRAQEGRIWVDCAWGNGSTFSFALPDRSNAERSRDLRGPKAPPVQS